jgi:hypothetical protein
MIDLEKYNSLPDWIFAKWEVQNNNESWIFLTWHEWDGDYWRLLKRVATKNKYDWAMYFWWSNEKTYEDIVVCWDKTYQIEHIKRLMNCDDDVIKKYRD